jgi:hypothetical protein
LIFPNKSKLLNITLSLSLLGVVNSPSPGHGMVFSLFVLASYLKVCLFVIDDREENSAAEGDQSAFCDCLDRDLPRFFCYEGQLAKIVTIFVVLIKCVSLAALGSEQTFDHNKKFSTHVAFVDDVLICFVIFICKQIAQLLEIFSSEVGENVDFFEVFNVKGSSFDDRHPLDMSENLSTETVEHAFGLGHHGRLPFRRMQKTQLAKGITRLVVFEHSYVALQTLLCNGALIEAGLYEKHAVAELPLPDDDFIDFCLMRNHAVYQKLLLD